jgi:hypothetical protein
MAPEEFTRRDFMSGATAAGAAAVQPFYYSSDITKVEYGNAVLAKDSFEVFRKTVRPNMLWNPFVYRLTRELQRFANALEAGKRPKMVISTPPQHGKSTAAEDFTAWIAGRNPDWKTIYASYSDELGVRCNLNLQRLFTSSRFRGVFPSFRVGHSRGLRAFWQLNSGLIEYIDHIGSFRNTTVRGQITGMELNLGIIDDFVKGRAEAFSKVDRDKTWHWFTDDFMTRSSKDSALLVIATRWHLDDLIGRVMKKWPKMHVLNFPALAEQDEGWRRKGEPLFHEHKPLEFLLERKALMTESSWSAEYQGRPFLVGSGEIPIEKLKVLPFFNPSDIASTVMSIDKAGTEGGDGAYTAIVIMHKMKNGTFVIEHVLLGGAGTRAYHQGMGRVH